MIELTPLQFITVLAFGAIVGATITLCLCALAGMHDPDDADAEGL